MYSFKSWDSKTKTLEVVSDRGEITQLTVDDNVLYDLEGNLVAVEEINGFEQANVCRNCKDTGYYEEEDRVECFKPASECCGGCYQNEWVECDCPDKIIKL